MDLLITILFLIFTKFCILFENEKKKFGVRGTLKIEEYKENTLNQYIITTSNKLGQKDYPYRQI